MICVDDCGEEYTCGSEDARGERIANFETLLDVENIEGFLGCMNGKDDKVLAS